MFDQLAVGQSPRVLCRVNQPECEIAVWDRQPLASFQAWINALNAELLPQARLILRPDSVHDAIIHLFNKVGMPACEERGMLAGDIAALSHMFAEITSMEYIKLRLGVGDHAHGVTKQQCAGRSQLLCQYVGHGIKLVPRSAENSTSISVPVGAPVILRRTTSDQPALFNVEVCSAAKKQGARLLLSLDAGEDFKTTSRVTTTLH